MCVSPKAEGTIQMYHSKKRKNTQAHEYVLQKLNAWMSQDAKEQKTPTKAPVELPKP